MTDKLIVVKDTGTCELATLKPYPAVQAGTNTTVTSSTNAAGKVTYTVSASGGEDSYVTGVTISPTGLVTLTRNNGLPNLTAQIPQPTEIVVPLIGARMGSTILTAAGSKAIFDTYVSGKGGFTETVGTTKFVIPHTGWYDISHRATARKQVAAAACSIRVTSNGSPLQTLGINFGTNYFPFMAVSEQAEVEKSMCHYLNAGDVIEVEANAMGAGAEWIGETFKILWHSAN